MFRSDGLHLDSAAIRAGYDGGYGYGDRVVFLVIELRFVKDRRLRAAYLVHHPRQDRGA